ncbi:PP2C family protein-serine/threonine phosphatase [Streptomyces sp. AK02-04a]|uniref:PP2C family protein-serine/threonine phosphatase n=1 Tax=Streptomyces sp. AK02-04a TaxID=3028649 RepID=UPI0029B7B9EF|nr:PP2C family protein-serine/threonine phosphatase [Streptomyces sp. AK02-04a]MDX3763498.1 PP2C family protein-serine/threonine phosphatase [Streptomyces sp. AK02-04a]
MAARQRFSGLRRPWQSGHALLVIPVVLILVITLVDIHSPPDVHLGPALVIAPAITASFAGPRLTGFIGVLALAAQAIIGVFHGGLATPNHMVQLVTIAVLSVLVVFLSAVRERRSRQLDQVRSVAEAAQHVLLWPLPERIGALRIACLYLAAEDEAQIGGDLYAATRIIGGVRIMIGDVRGKGLSAIGEAALLLGAFREAAHRHASLPDLAAALEQSVTRYLADFEPVEETGERFATALLLELPDDDHITRIISCGHPPPLVLSPGRALTVPSLHPAPPLGIGEMGPEGYTIDVLSFGAGDTLLLYTDGVIEARDADGDFYPFETRAGQWSEAGPESLLHHIQRDLLAHTSGRLEDDAALVALRREPDIHRRRHHHGRVIHASG